MTLERIEHKVFASEAPLEEMGQFGSALATTKLNTKDVAEIQALPAYAKGWGSAIISENNYPAMEEMNGVLNVMSYHTGYLYQEGIPVYSSTQTYSATSWVKDLAGSKIYKSLQDDNKGRDLADTTYWKEISLGGGTGLQLFDTILKDHVLSYEETKGLALQGTYVYKEALAGSRYGYPDFYNKVVEEYNEATQTETINGVTVKVHSNGHKFYDIADKTAIDNFYDSLGLAWFYGVDTENERIFLPRDKYFAVTSDVSVYGSGKALGLTDGTKNAGLYYWQSANPWLVTNVDSFNKNVGVESNSTSNRLTYDRSIGVTTNATKSGIKGKLTSNTDKYLYICVGNTTNYEGVTEVVNQGMEILEQVSQKVNIDGTNLNTEGKTLITSYSFPSNRYIDLTLGASSSTYTAPANGWIVLCKNSSATNQYLCLGLGLADFNQRVYSSANNQTLSLMSPVTKNTNIYVEYSLAGVTKVFRFYYAEGDK